MERDTRYDLARLYRGLNPDDRIIAKASLPSALAEIQEISADKYALAWYEDGVLSRRLLYGEILSHIRTMADWLTSTYNVHRGDRVVVISSNCPEVYVAHLAVMSLGAVTVPVGNAESSRVLHFILEQVNPRIILRGRRISPELTFSGYQSADLLPLQFLELDKRHIHGISGPSQFWTGGGAQPDDLAVILYTSGTTSSPKGVCLSHYNLLVNAEGLNRKHNLKNFKSHMCVLPLYHANAFGFSMIASIYSHSVMTLCDGFPGLPIWSILRAEKVDLVSLVPEIIRVLTDIAEPCTILPDLKYVVSAAAPLPKAVSIAFTRRTGIKIHQGYGLSESVNFSATIDWDVPNASYEQLMEHWSVPSIGTELYGSEVSVRLEDGSKAEDGAVGEIAVTGHSVMLGYWQAPTETRSALEEGYLRTGDLGFSVAVNGQPHFFITGRKKEIIIRYGETISPLTIEAELQALRAIGPFAAIGIPNDAAGEEIGLYISAGSSKIDRRRVVEIVMACPTRYRPRVVLIGAQPLPTTATGKVKRAQLTPRFSSYTRRSFGSDPVISDILDS